MITTWQNLKKNWRDLREDEASLLLHCVEQARMTEGCRLKRLRRHHFAFRRLILGILSRIHRSKWHEVDFINRIGKEVKAYDKPGRDG